MDRQGFLKTLGEACQKRASHSGPARQAHDEQAAAKWLGLGLKALGLRPADLGGMFKDPFIN